MGLKQIMLCGEMVVEIGIADGCYARSCYLRRIIIKSSQHGGRISLKYST